jgi:7-cyano-7-deazaguanine reductase|nr:MAG TPA: 7-cyano-7-deazaguanine reductase [Caudoviricetes sp.]
MTGRNEKELDGVNLLGNNHTKYLYDYDPSVLETFENKHKDNDYMVTFTCPEFTSLCPKTGQPDFAEIIINYIPGERMVESKSLKLYLFSFRNHGDFHEDCINIIMKDLVNLMKPKYIEVKGNFTPRGGIAILPFANYAEKDSIYEKYVIERQFNQLSVKKGAK